MTVPDGATADVSVRPASPADADAVAAVQVTTWRAAYADLLPPGVLASLDPPALAAAWRAAAAEPPTPRHHLLVAVEAGRVVGFAASGPAVTPDAGGGVGGDAELLLLLVEPAAGRAGHGSRLLAASVEAWRSDGSTRAEAWLLDGDAVTERFLRSAGWDRDGAARGLDAGGARIAQVRLHTDLGPGPA